MRWMHRICSVCHAEYKIRRLRCASSPLYDPCGPPDALLETLHSRLVWPVHYHTSTLRRIRSLMQAMVSSSATCLRHRDIAIERRTTISIAGQSSGTTWPSEIRNRWRCASDNSCCASIKRRSTSAMVLFSPRSPQAEGVC